MEYGEPVVGDAFGATLRACWTGGGVPGVAYDVVERDDGHIFVDDACFWFTTPAAEQRVCDGLTGRVLDVGCGAGRHAAPLAARGVDVVGVDSSPEAVAICRERGVDARLGSVSRLDGSLGRFDAFLLLGNNLGLLGTEAQAHGVLTDLARLARPGARLYGTSMDPHAVDIPEERAYREHNRRRGRLPGQTRLRVRAGGLTSGWFDYLFLSPRELADLTAGTGWTLTDVTANGMDYLAELTARES
jgi:SAM-dependent methyltransferase